MCLRNAEKLRNVEKSDLSRILRALSPLGVDPDECPVESPQTRNYYEHELSDRQSNAPADGGRAWAAPGLGFDATASSGQTWRELTASPLHGHTVA